MEQWQPLADALTYAMTETGVTPDSEYVQHVAQDATDWLNSRGFSIVEDAQIAAEARDMHIMVSALVRRCGGEVELNDRELTEASGKIKTWRNMRRDTTHVRVEAN